MLPQTLQANLVGWTCHLCEWGSRTVSQDLMDLGTLLAHGHRHHHIKPNQMNDYLHAANYVNRDPSNTLIYRPTPYPRLPLSLGLHMPVEDLQSEDRPQLMSGTQSIDHLLRSFDNTSSSNSGTRVMEVDGGTSSDKYCTKDQMLRTGQARAKRGSKRHRVSQNESSMTKLISGSRAQGSLTSSRENFTRTTHTQTQKSSSTQITAVNSQRRLHNISNEFLLTATENLEFSSLPVAFTDWDAATSQLLARRNILQTNQDPIPLSQASRNPVENQSTLEVHYQSLNSHSQKHPAGGLGWEDLFPPEQLGGRKINDLSPIPGADTALACISVDNFDLELSGIIFGTEGQQAMERGVQNCISSNTTSTILPPQHRRSEQVTQEPIRQRSKDVARVSDSSSKPSEALSMQESREEITDCVSSSMNKYWSYWPGIGEAGELLDLYEASRNSPDILW